MKNIVDKILEGFFGNTCSDKYIDIINNFGKIIGKHYYDVKKAGMVMDIPKRSKLYEKLYDMFNEIPSFEASYDTEYGVEYYGNPRINKCIQHFTFTKKDNKYKCVCVHEYLNKYTGEVIVPAEGNKPYESTYKSIDEMLSYFCYYIKNSHLIPTLEKTAKFIITH